jgi:hypothetical protein
MLRWGDTYKLATSLSKVKLLTTVSAGAFVLIKHRFLFIYFFVKVLYLRNYKSFFKFDIFMFIVIKGSRSKRANNPKIIFFYFISDAYIFCPVKPFCWGRFPQKQTLNSFPTLYTCFTLFQNLQIILKFIFAYLAYFFKRHFIKDCMSKLIAIIAIDFEYNCTSIF